MSTSLVQAVRDFKKMQSGSGGDGIVVQSVSWDLDTSFVGESMDSRTIRLLSRYVDRCLVGYSSIHNSAPAQRSLPMSVKYDDPDIVHRSMNQRVADVGEFDAEAAPEHVCADRDTDSFVNVNTTLEEPRGDNLGERYRQDVGEVCRCLDLAADDGIPGSILYGDFEVCDNAAVLTDDGRHNIESMNVRRVQGSDVEAVRYRLSDDDMRLPIPPIVPDIHVYGSGQLPSVTDRVRDSFLRVPEQKSTDLDNPIPVMPSPQPPPVCPSSLKVTTSYVTSYNLNHRTMKISARIVTVPSGMKVDSTLWYGCGDTDLKDIVRKTMRANMVIQVGSRSPLDTVNEAEMVAQETLREMVTEREFRRYLKYGFVSICGRSGDVYQLYRDRPHVKVWHGKELLEEVCVYVRDHSVPPTDKVVGLMCMIYADEEAFKAAGNRYKYLKKTSIL
jgi:hypothetical protein